MQEFFEHSEDDINPIDNVEEILNANNWTFIRPNEDELVVEVSGKNSKYNLCFIWQDKMNALQFACRHNITIADDKMEQARRTTMSINESLWLGHFDLPEDTKNPIFRYTCLLHGAGKASATEVIEEVVDAALLQCERYYPILQLMSEDAQIPLDNNSMSLALMETVGQS